LYLKSVWWLGGYGQISGRPRVLLLATGRHEAPARRSLAVDQPCDYRASPGGGVDVTHASGQSHAEKGLDLEVAILKMSRHREAMFGEVFGN
jgi:hypothetical protein